MLPNCEIVMADGIQYILFKKDDIVSNNIRAGGYEPEIIELALRLLMPHPNGIVLDIGANIGSFVLPLARKLPKFQYHAFEPQRIVSYQLCANVLINALDNVRVHNFAISNHTNRIMLPMPDYFKEVNIGAFSINPEVRANEYECTSVGDTEAVDTKTLDFLLYQWNDVRLIKVDVEGHELEVLKGAVKTLEANNYPPIIFEAWTWKPWFEAKRKELFEFVNSLGYDIKEIGENNLATYRKNK